MTYQILHGDCIEQMRTLPDNSVDAIVTDPPAGIAFMGKAWDSNRGGRAQWVAWLTEVMSEAHRVLKPGGHALVWALPRTSHWTALALEDAGFEIRDAIQHLFGSGFPKSHNLSGDWQGWGTALKPGAEIWWLCRKPLSEPTVASNVAQWGTGALNIDGTRIRIEPGEIGSRVDKPGHLPNRPINHMNDDGSFAKPRNYQEPSGRWPANVILDEDAAEMLDAQSGECPSGGRMTSAGGKPHGFISQRSSLRSDTGLRVEPSTGGASRFFYQSKASRKERRGSKHPTVKPVALMRYLVRLITPPGGVVLDMFAGSGTTGEACVLEGFNCILIEREAEYIEDIKRRFDAVQPPLGMVAD